MNKNFEAEITGGSADGGAGGEVRVRLPKEISFKATKIAQVSFTNDTTEVVWKESGSFTVVVPFFTKVKNIIKSLIRKAVGLHRKIYPPYQNN